MKLLLAISTLVALVLADTRAKDTSSICDLAINRVCEVKAGPLLKHATLQLMDEETQVDLVGGAAWRVSFYRYPHQFALVVEQAKGRYVWWNVYLLGRNPNIRFQFETVREEGVREFTLSPHHGLKTCMADTPGVCDQVIAVKQILAGHLEASRLSWRVGPGILAALDYVMAECTAHLGQPCGEDFTFD
ncbi:MULTISPECIES: hypothetical protein [Kordiimonas]|uniref:hypothetical protein n=1 Tax=Kordiimonas TaxID=288021 RepID=UPI002580C9D2|nr:hypothetical protein [Kordiimonas sp. UBA4487]